VAGKEAADVLCAERESAGTYRAWLIMTAPSESKLEKRLYAEGLAYGQSDPCFAMFLRLIQEHRAASISPIPPGSS
jgi:hypothetical protein